MQSTSSRRITRATIAWLMTALAAAGCSPAVTPPVASPAATASTTAATETAAASPAPGGLAAIRSRGTVVVSLRIESPPSGGAAGDPAHGQKRAFEAEVASLVAKRAFGQDVKVDLRGVGADRSVPVERGEADIAMTVTGPAGSERVALSAPFGRSAIVLAVPAASSVTEIGQLAGKTVAAGMEEVPLRGLVEESLKAQGITVTIQRVMGLQPAVNSAISGQVSAVIGDAAGLELLFKDKPDSLRVIAELVPVSHVIAVSKTSPELKAALDAALRDLLASGEIRAAAERAGLPYRPPR